MVIPRRFASWTGWSGFFKGQGNPPPPAHRAADWGAAHHGAQSLLVRLRQVSVPGDIDADVRFG